jgi:hypothetical protein
MTHKDLARSKKQYQMSFVEFLEAIARVAEYKDLDEPEEMITRGKWGDDLLDDKLETALTEAARSLKPDGSPKKTLSGFLPSPPTERS